MPPPPEQPPRSSLTLQSAALVLSLCLNAWLLGRQSVAPQIIQVLQAPTAEPARRAPDTGLSAAPAAPAAAPFPANPDLSSLNRNAEVLAAAERAEAAAEAAEKAEAGAEAAAGSAAETERQAVSRYFAEVDLLFSAALREQGASDEATVVVGQVIQGDTEGLTRLRRQGESNLRPLRALSVPPSCQGYHRKVIRSAEQGVDTLLQVENAANGGDLEAVARLAPRAGSNREEARTLSAEGRVLRARFGGQ